MGANTLSQNSSIAGSDSKEFYKQYFFYILFKRKWLIIILAILGIFGTALGTYLCTYQYKAISKIVVRSNVSQEVTLFPDLYRQVPRSSNVIPANNFIEIANSHAAARAIVEKFELDKRLKKQFEEPDNFREYVWSYYEKLKDWLKEIKNYPSDLYEKLTTGKYPEKKEKAWEARALKKFLEDTIEINVVADSDIINLTIWGESPKEAEAMANELTNFVVQRSISLEQNVAAYGYNFSKEELGKARKELAFAEEELNQYKQKWDISKIEMQKEIALSELDEMERKLVLVNSDLSSKRAKIDEIRKQLEEQKKRLTSLDSYQNLLKEQVSLTVDISGLTAQKEQLESDKGRIAATLRKLVEKELELVRLEREMKLKEEHYTKLGTKHNELDVQRVSKLTGIDLRVVDTPKLSENVEYDYPDWELNLLIGIPASIILAFGIAFLLELMNESFWTGDQIKKKLNIPLLGTIHEVKGGVK